MEMKPRVVKFIEKSERKIRVRKTILAIHEKIKTGFTPYSSLLEYLEELTYVEGKINYTLIEQIKVVDEDTAQLFSDVIHYYNYIRSEDIKTDEELIQLIKEELPILREGLATLKYNKERMGM